MSVNDETQNEQMNQQNDSNDDDIVSTMTVQDTGRRRPALKKKKTKMK